MKKYAKDIGIVDDEKIYKELYFKLAKSVNEHIKTSKELEKVLNGTLEFLFQSNIDNETKKKLIDFITY